MVELLGLKVTVLPPIEAIAKNQHYWNQYFSLIDESLGDMDAYLERDFSFWNATLDNDHVADRNETKENRDAMSKMNIYSSNTIPLEYGWYIPEYAYGIKDVYRDIVTQHSSLRL